MNLLERTIEIISPEWAFKRSQFQNGLAYSRKLERGYNAGGYGPRLIDIDRTVRSPSMETISTLKELRGFSRDLERNNEWVGKAIQVLGNHTVGAGIRPAIGAKGVANLWNSWADTLDCDFDGLNDMYGLQDLAFLGAVRDGESITIRKWDRRKNAKFPFQIQVLEADFLDENKTQPYGNNHQIVQGVEFDVAGRKVAYWLFEQHPYDQMIYKIPQSIRVPIDDVIHLHRVDRAGQVRGIPTGVQAFIRINDLAEYDDAEIIRKKMAACFTAFVTTENGVPTTANQVREASRMEPGTVQYLPPGDSVTIANPPQTEGYGEFNRQNGLKVSAAYGITYEAMTNDLSNVNFSSGKMGHNEMGGNIARWQNRVMIPRFCNPVYDWFIQGAILLGKTAQRPAVSWTPPRRPMIDPDKEYAAREKALRAGLTSWQETVREDGWDPIKLKEELAQDRDMWDELKLKPTSDQRFDKPAAEPGAKAK